MIYGRWTQLALRTPTFYSLSLGLTRRGLPSSRVKQMYGQSEATEIRRCLINVSCPVQSVPRRQVKVYGYVCNCWAITEKNLEGNAAHYHRDKIQYDQRANMLCEFLLVSFRTCDRGAGQKLSHKMEDFNSIGQPNKNEIVSSFFPFFFFFFFTKI